MSYLSIRQKEDWYGYQYFISKHLIFYLLGIKLLGYFPYHHARIKPNGVDPTIIKLPRTMFHEVESILKITNLVDNKSVYIFEVIDSHTVCDNFAMMIKDDYVLIGSWDEVVNWDLSPLK